MTEQDFDAQARQIVGAMLLTSDPITRHWCEEHVAAALATAYQAGYEAGRIGGDVFTTPKGTASENQNG